MGLAGGSTHVALFLFVTATFALAVGALSLAVTVGESVGPSWNAPPAQPLSVRVS